MAEVDARYIAKPHGATVAEWFARLRRRSLTVSVLFCCTSLLVATLPCTLVLAGIADLARPTRPWARVRAMLAFTWIASCESVGVVAAFATWVAFLVHRRPSWFLRHNEALQRRWTDALFAGARCVFGMKLEVRGAGTDSLRGPVIVLVRHASSVDTVLAAAVLANRSSIQLRYVLKSELLYDPCIDIVGNRLRNAFVGRGAKGDIAKVRQLGYELGRDEGVLIYPEGTRFSERKLARVKAKLQDGAAAPETYEGFEHVLPPRPGGTLALLKAAPDADILIVNHTGLEGAASLADVWRGELVGTTLRVSLRYIPARDIPDTACDDAAWLTEEWMRVNDWVGDHRKGEPAKPFMGT